MKPRLPIQKHLSLTLLCLCAASLQAADLTLKDGRKLVKVEVITEEGDRVKLMHDAGLAWVDKAQVPAEFLAANGITPPAAAATEMTTPETDERITKLRAAFPSFKDKDGRLRDTAHLTAVEPTGLKFVIDSAVVRVPFHKLPKPVADALGMDAESVANARQDLEAKQASAREEHSLRMTATSILARQKCFVRLEVVQYDNDGYICYGTVVERKLEQKEVQVDYNRLSRAKVVETQNVVTVEDGRPLGRMKVYGLPDNLVGKKVWQGELWLGGERKVETAQGEDIYTRDAFTALQAGVDHLVKNGLGDLVEDLGESHKTEENSPVDPFGSPMKPGPHRPGMSPDPFAPSGAIVPTNTGTVIRRFRAR